jgi:uncharacterized protein YciI
MEDENVFIILYDLSDKKLSESFYDYSDIIIKHWKFLKKLKSEKNLIFAGTTLDSYYEITIVKAKSIEEAGKLAKNDPFVYNRLLPVFLYDFRATLLTDEQVPEVLEEEYLDIEAIYDEETEFYMGTITGRPTFINDMTEEEGKIMGVHFEYLKEKFDNKDLILAGPILAEGRFGLSIIKAENLEKATLFTKNDPAVKEGILESNVHPFRIFLKED